MVTIDELVRTRRRTLAIIIDDGGRLVVRAPLRMPARDIDEFVASKEKWIRAKQGQVRQRMQRFTPKRYVPGEEFLYLGEPYRLEISDTQRPSLAFDDRFSLARAALPNAASLFEKWYRRRALRVITERVDLYAQAHGFAHNGVRISSARRQWGSCGPDGTLRFAWRLVMAPLPVIDYVVVHELAHLRYKSHGKRFWGKVRSILPDFAERRAWLGHNGYLLDLG
jgi:predicted metal-dependent hydrolase